MRKNIFNFFILFFFFFSLSFSIAQEKLSLTITPPLIKVNLSPGQVWQSSVKIVNNNPQDLNIFVSVMDFKSGPEGGVVFIKDGTEKDMKFLLSQWIDFPKESIFVPAFQSKNIPFSIKVPSDAEPGGKYAAILVGTKPSDQTSGTAIKISPQVSSLILASVRGNIEEAIWVREFSTDKNFYQKPKVNFTLKIENIGNVHVQPRGEIKILNMYGKERGTIALNQKTDYGNILPQSLRKWNFKWEGDASLFEAGRYKAVLTLNYGSDIKKTEERTIYFWFLPILPLLGIIAGIFIFFVTIFVFVKIYVKRAVIKTLKEAKKKIIPEPEKKPALVINLKEKITSDIRSIKEKSTTKEKEFASTKKEFFQKIMNFILSSKKIVLIFVLFFVTFIISVYFYNVLKEHKEYKIEIPEQKEQILPEKILEKIEEEAKTEKVVSESAQEKIDVKSFSVSILNGSGIKGLANELATKLTKEGFKIEKTGNAERFDYQKTVIFYKKEKEKEAQFLNKFLGEKFEIKENKNQEGDIVIIIGKDFSL